MHDLIQLLRIGPSWDYWSFDRSIAESLLYAIALPPDLPVEIPLPPHSTLVGSAIPMGQGDPEIVLETELDPEDLLAVYERHLQAGGWELLEYLHDTYGLVPAQEPEVGAIYYDEASERELVVRVRRGSAPPHSIYLTLRYQDDPHGSLGFDAHLKQILPLLPAPASSSIETRGGMAGGTAASSSAVVRVDLTPLALHAHYAEQLRTRGWDEVRVEEVQVAPRANGDSPSMKLLIGPT